MFKVGFSSLSALERPTEKLIECPICPPGTEIFSKRRKIYSLCVESLSMTEDYTRPTLAIYDCQDTLEVEV